MKINRFFLAVALLAAAAACTADLTAPERRAPAGYSANEADTTHTTTATPKDVPAGDTGFLGSGGGK